MERIAENLLDVIAKKVLKAKAIQFSFNKVCCFFLQLLDVIFLIKNDMAVYLTSNGISPSHKVIAYE